jgi:hypothetical protein
LASELGAVSAQRGMQRVRHATRARAYSQLASAALLVLATACGGGDAASMQRGSGSAAGASAVSGSGGASGASQAGNGGGGISAAPSGGASGAAQAGASGASSAGGSGAAGTGSTRDAGVAELPSGLTPPDPSVTFEWTATLPGGADDCRPGHYTGTFMCEYFAAPTDTMATATVTGPITLTLERSQDGEFLEITDGKLEGFAQLIIGFRAQIEGRLDCGSRELDANAIDGVYGFGDPAIFPISTFEGPISGALDSTTGALVGSWEFELGTGGSCYGPWQANWAP